MTANSVGPQPGYWAFISYSNVDRRQARKLHRRIELYSIPGPLVGTAIPAGVAPKRFHPVFLDRLELPATASLTNEIQTAIAQSHHLIVVCSRAAARSAWVENEIRAFRALGRADRILAVIVDGDPNARDDNACFPPALRDIEPVAADLRDGGDGWRTATLKLLAGMLGVNLDAVRQREAQRSVHRLQLLLAMSLLAAAVLGASAWYVSRQRDIADANRKNAEEVLDFLVYNLSVELERVGHPEILDMVRNRIDEYYRELGPDPADIQMLAARAVVDDNTAGQQLRDGDLDQALAGFLAARTIREGLARRERDQPDWLYLLAVSDAQIGDVLRARGDYPAAIGSYQSSLDLMRRVKEAPDLPSVFRHQTVVANEAIAQVRLLQGDVDQAMAAYDAASEALQKLLSRQPEIADDPIILTDIAELYGGFGKIWTAREEWKLAEPALLKAADARDRLAGRGPLDIEALAAASSAHDGLARTCVELGDMRGALSSYEASLSYLDRLAALKPIDAGVQSNRLASMVNIGNLQDLLSVPGDAWQRAHSLRREMMRRRMAIDAAANAEIDQHPD